MGGPQRDRKFLEDFRKTLDDCELVDIKPIGNIFTWHGNRKGHHIWERLDRFVCNSSFDSLFNFAGSNNLEWMFSDHRPIEVNLEDGRQRTRGKRRKMFKFEEYWTKWQECAKIIKNNGIRDGNEMFYPSLSEKLLNCSKTLMN